MSKTKSTKEKYPAHLGTRQIVFTNLLLLGLEPGALEVKYNIPFTKDMFTLPNKKAFEVVMHFLFAKLNPAMAADKFRVCWPISDKKQEQVFRRAIVNWLQDISKDDPDSHLPRIVPSLFLSPGGDKFYTLLLYFSQYVVYKAIRGENGEKERDLLKKPQLSPGMSALSSIIVKSYQSATIRRQKRALEQTQMTVLIHRQWQTFASELVKDYRALSKSIRELDHRVKDLYAKSYDLAQARGEIMTSRRRSGVKSDGEKEILAVKRAQKLQKVRELWKVVDDLMASQTPEREVVESILQEVSSKSKLDADDIHVQVPELLLRECEAEIQRRNIGNVYQAGKLSLLSLIQLWNLALQLYLEKIHQAPLANFDSLAPSVITQVHTHHAHLTNAQALRSTLSKEIVPELKSSITQLKMQTSMQRTPGKGSSLRPFHSTTLGLGLLSATPPVSFEPVQGPTPFKLPSTTAIGATHNADTPEAVSRLSSAVDKAALRSSGLVQGTPSGMLRDLREQIHGPSRLPVPSDSMASSSTRKRVKSAPSKVASTDPELLIHSRPKPTPGQSQRKHVTKVSRTGTKLGGRTTRAKKEDRQMSSTSKSRNSRLIDGTPVSTRQSNNNSSVMSTGRKSRVNSTVKAHQILVDQIANAVMSGDGDGDTISPAYNNGLSSLAAESSSHQTAMHILNDPLAALDESAFVSRDKLKHTPTEIASMTYTKAPPAPKRGTPLNKATRTLFADNAKYTGDQRLSVNRTHDDPRLRATPQGVRATPKGMRATPQDPQSQQLKAENSISNLLDLSNGNMFPEEVNAVNEDGLLQMGEYVHLKDDSRMPLDNIAGEFSPTDVPLDNFKTASMDPHRTATSSVHTPSSRPTSVRKDHTPTGLPLEDLEQTLLEITRTKTPQLPFRSRQRVNQVTSILELDENPEDDLITSTRLSLAPGTMMNTSLGTSPQANKKLNQSLEAVARTGKESCTTEADTNVTNGLTVVDIEMSNAQSKTRQASSGSQKSVTFSDHIDEHSFQDLGRTPSASYLDEVPEEHQEDGAFDIIDVHSSQTFDFDEITKNNAESSTIQSHCDSPRENLGSGQNQRESPVENLSQIQDSSPLEHDNGLISETYLRRSPQSKLDLFESRQSPLGSVLQSELDLSEAMSPDPASRMQLLEHISPMMTPSKTPKLAPRKGALFQARNRTTAQHVSSGGSPFNGLDLSPALRTPVDVESEMALLRGLSDLRLSISSTRPSSRKMTDDASEQKRARNALEFSGLFDDEDDSILMSGSPLSKSIHDDISSSPLVQNLIDF